MQSVVEITCRKAPVIITSTPSSAVPSAIGRCHLKTCLKIKGGFQSLHKVYKFIRFSVNVRGHLQTRHCLNHQANTNLILISMSCKGYAFVFPDNLPSSIFNILLVIGSQSLRLWWNRISVLVLYSVGSQTDLQRG